MSDSCVIRKGVFGRWFLFHPHNIIKAWSGARFVNCGCDGRPNEIQICNFESEQEAREYCREHGLKVED